MVGGGHKIHGGGRGDIYEAVVLVTWQRAMDGGTGMRLISHQLPPLELASMFTRGWQAEE